MEDRLNAALGMTAEEMDTRARAYEADDVDFADGDEVRDGSPFCKGDAPKPLAVINRF